MEWKIGCSGYHYPEWKRVFYPDDMPQRKWFDYYCGHFNTLELNVTYYKFPRLEFLKRWYERSPPGFTFTVKAPRHITRFKKFQDARQMLDDFNGVSKEGLGSKLGCVLYQFPSNFHYEASKLGRIIEMMDPSLKNVVEFRHQSWWNGDVFAALASTGIIFCGMSHPSLPEAAITTGQAIYYRFHGVPHLYNSLYEIQKLEQVVQRISSGGATEAFIYFNNTASGHAVTNAKQLQDICELVH